jgi:hypothetical protein
MRITSQQLADSLRCVFEFILSRYPDVHTLEVTYEGSGDDGQVQDFTAYKLDKKSPWGIKSLSIDFDIETPPNLIYRSVYEDINKYRKQKSYTVAELLDSLCWDLAYSQNPGFEINEGGYGKVVIGFDSELPTGSDCSEKIIVKVEHSQRIIETEDSTFVF